MIYNEEVSRLEQKNIRNLPAFYRDMLQMLFSQIRIFALLHAFL